MTEVVDGESFLVAVGRGAAFLVDDTGIVEEHMDRAVRRQDFVRHSSDVGQTAHIPNRQVGA